VRGPACPTASPGASSPSSPPRSLRSTPPGRSTPT
jgi:hypothetical protein